MYKRRPKKVAFLQPQHKTQYRICSMQMLWVFARAVQLFDHVVPAISYGNSIFGLWIWFFGEAVWADERSDDSVALPNYIVFSPLSRFWRRFTLIFIRNALFFLVSAKRVARNGSTVKTLATTIQFRINFIVYIHFIHCINLCAILL